MVDERSRSRRKGLHGQKKLAHGQSKELCRRWTAEGKDNDIAAMKDFPSFLRSYKEIVRYSIAPALAAAERPEGAWRSTTRPLECPLTIFPAPILF